MCIRDSNFFGSANRTKVENIGVTHALELLLGNAAAATAQAMHCLLYTSDAADERSSVDLGGRRIIKKKKNRQIREWSEIN